MSKKPRDAENPSRPGGRTLSAILAELERFHGRPDLPPLRDPLHWILWENVAYLADDVKRAAAFQALESKVGFDPEDLQRAPARVLREIGRAGILPDLTVKKVREIGRIAVSEFGGDLRSVCGLPLPAAKKALKKFPSIGDPGAEKILLFTRSYPVFALESNGLRVLLRLGFGEEGKGYAATYRSVRAAAAKEAAGEFDWLIRAHQTLRRHGRTLCRRNRPSCSGCPVSPDCGYARESSPSGP